MSTNIPVAMFVVCMALLLGFGVSSGATTQNNRPAIQASLPAPNALATFSPVSMDTAISEALAHNPIIRAAAAHRDQVMAGFVPFDVGFHPSVQATVSQSFQGPQVALPLVTGPDLVLPWEEQRVTVSASQLIYHAGKGPARAQYMSERSAADADLQATIGSTLRDVMKAYCHVLQTGDGEVVALQTVTDLQAGVDSVQTLIQAGHAVQLDLLQAQASLAQAQQQADSTENAHKSAIANLNRLMGRPLLNPTVVESAEVSLWVPVTLEEAIHKALIDRPDIRQAEAQLKSAQEGLKLARLENAPTVSAQAAYQVQTPTALQRTTEWSLGAVVTIPIMQSVQQQSDVAQAAAGIEAAQAGLDATRGGAEAVVFSAWQNLQTALSGLTADMAQTAAQEEALRAIKLKLQVGEATQSDVAQTRLSLASAQLAQENDRYGIILREIDLQYEMGLLSEGKAAR